MKPIQINNNHYQECDVVMLATKNPTVLRENQMWTHTNDGGKIVKLQPTFNYEKPVRADELKGYCVPQDLYILSNDEIEEGIDYYYDSHNNLILKSSSNSDHEVYKYKKVCATTDSSLSAILKGDTFAKLIPEIPQSFIEYFISEYNKGRTVDKVLVEVEETFDIRYYTPAGGIECANKYNIKYKLKLNQNNEISILNNTPLFDNNDIEAAKKYIGLPLNREMDEEERYYNSKHREYDAFLAGIAYEKSKRN